MQEKVYAKDVKTVEQLKKRVQRAWRDIEPEILQNLAVSMTTRLRDVIKSNGGSTRY